MRTFKSQDKPKKQRDKSKELNEKSRSRDPSQESSNYQIKPKSAKANTPSNINIKKVKKVVPKIKAQNRDIVSNA